MNYDELQVAGYHSAIETHDSLREACLRIAKRDPAVMGSSAWLSVALSSYDLSLTASAEGVVCYGSTYTTQTMENEWFEFEIPWSMLTNELEQTRR